MPGEVRKQVAEMLRSGRSAGARVATTEAVARSSEPGDKPRARKRTAKRATKADDQETNADDREIESSDD